MKNKRRPREYVYGEVQKELIQLQGMTHFLENYDLDVVLPENLNEYFYGFATVFEEKLKHIRELINQLETGEF